MNEIKEHIDTFSNRIKSPFVWYFKLAFISFNWDAFFYLIFDTGKAEQGIRYYKENTTVWSLTIISLCVAVISVIVYHNFKKQLTISYTEQIY